MKVKKDIVAIVTEAMEAANVKPTKSSVIYYYLKTLQEVSKSLDQRQKLPLVEGADLDPEQVQAALEDAAGQLSVLQDFLSPDNMQRFEAAAEFIPQLEEFFGSLNTHFELQKQKEEEAEAEAEEAASQAEAEAEQAAEDQAAEAEEEADAAAAEDEAESEEAEATDAPPPEDAPPAEKAETEPEEEELNESVLHRWKTLANLKG